MLTYITRYSDLGIHTRIYICTRQTNIKSGKNNVNVECRITNLEENDARAPDGTLTTEGDTMTVFFDVCNNSDVYLVINILYYLAT